LGLIVVKLLHNLEQRESHIILMLGWFHHIWLQTWAWICKNDYKLKVPWWTSRSKSKQNSFDREHVRVSYPPAREYTIYLIWR